VSPDLASIIETMPAAVLLLRAGRTIAEVSGRFASVFGRPVVELVGSDLLRYVVPDDADYVTAVIAEARAMPTGSVPAGVVARFEQPDGSKRLVEVSASFRDDGSPGGATVVLIRLQTVRHGLNAALIPHVGWHDTDERASVTQIAHDALETIAGVLVCEPVGQDCYFLTVNDKGDIPLQHPLVPGLDPATSGPWDVVLAGRVNSVDVEVAALSPELQDFARRCRYTAVRSVPVLASHRDRIVGCLVAWDHREGPISRSTVATFRYAAEIASLAIGRTRPSGPLQRGQAAPWPSDIDVVTGLPLEAGLVRSLDEMVSGGQRPGLVCIRLKELESLRGKLSDFTIDTLIRVAARRVYSLIRQTDEVYRVGHDGIAVICTGSIDAKRLADIADRMRLRLESPFRVDTDSPVDVGAKIAAAESPDEPITGTDFLASVMRVLA
jgi:PAS domain S-box-containing protein